MFSVLVFTGSSFGDLLFVWIDPTLLREQLVRESFGCESGIPLENCH